MPKGDIILVAFPFTDLSATKVRPAVILTETDIDITANFITTQVKWQESKDLLLEVSQTNGLKKPSLIITGKIATLNNSLILGLLGKLTNDEIDKLNQKLKIVLQLD
ncbi:type II toxin-antitoxin system PemK/MazF family toxin [Mucilaginibacter sp. dw_454]|uniref:type II toxin-antitoxin system PemK/MazF family toxin n=1 Tax=Mucilaginibacter sp. dw_454 TaxID=2720079 RepID=UPI001BD2B0E4|nr:type II toxin-antitoxin system PemK/MazF family toxin [Mucilaginibacter sp. dw_454]